MENRKIVELEKELEKLRLKPPGSELVSVLNEIAYAYRRSDSQKAETTALEAQRLADELDLPIEKANSYRMLASVYLETGNFADTMSNCRQAMEIFEQLGDIRGMALVHTTIAFAYRSQGNIDTALEHHLDSLRMKQEYAADKDDLAKSYFNLGTCYSILNYLDQAQPFFEQALEVWEKSDNLEQLSFIYNNIGCFYGRKKELDTAREYFQKALDIWVESGDKKGIARTLTNFGIVFRDLGDFESALDYYGRSLALYQEISNRRGIAHTSSCIGGIYTKQGRLDEAEELIMMGLGIARELKFQDREILSLEKIVDLCKAKGDLKQALIYSKELIALLEEYMNEKSSEKIARLQVQFETEKKEKEAEIYRLRNVELSKINDQLRDALEEVNTLRGMFPICSNCMKVRDDEGYWQQIESYISEHSDAIVSYGICPECFIRLYGKINTGKKI